MLADKFDPAESISSGGGRRRVLVKRWAVTWRARVESERRKQPNAHEWRWLQIG